MLALFGDSTNIDRKGFSGSEIDVVDAFEEIFTSTPGMIVVAAFSSSIYRMQVVVDLAAQFERKVAFVGRGMISTSTIAQELGYLKIPTGVQIRDSDVRNHPAAEDVLPQHRIAGRADGGAAAHRHRRSPARQDRRGRHRRLLGPRRFRATSGPSAG